MRCTCLLAIRTLGRNSETKFVYFALRSDVLNVVGRAVLGRAEGRDRVAGVAAPYFRHLPATLQTTLSHSCVDLLVIENA